MARMLDTIIIVFFSLLVDKKLPEDQMFPLASRLVLSRDIQYPFFFMDELFALIGCSQPGYSCCLRLQFQNLSKKAVRNL